jgi:hypothetical protein
LGRRRALAVKQQVAEGTWVFQGQHVEFVGHGQHDIKAASGPEFVFTRRQPTLARLRLALGAVPVSARVVGDGLMTAVRAGIAMAAERFMNAVLGSQSPSTLFLKWCY